MKRFMAMFLAIILFIAEFSLTAEAAEVDAPKTIVGFDALERPYQEFHINKENKPSEEELLKALPNTLEVYLEGKTEAEEIEVSWFCVGEDFDESDSYYFQFSPMWDEESYVLSEEMNVIADAPYVSIFLTDEGAESAAINANSNEAIIFKFLVNEMKFNVAGACGIVANIQKESAFNPNATGDRGTSYGICQWHNERWTSLKTWCNSNGYDWTTLDGQLHYLQYELSANNYKVLYNGKTTYNAISAVSNNAQGAYDAASYWCINYEIPADKYNVAIVRGNLAKDTYWPKYGYLKTPVSPEITSAVVEGSDITISWNAVSGVDSYVVQRSVESGERSSVIIDVGASTRYTDTNLVKGERYIYSVYAKNLLGTSTQENTYQVRCVEEFVSGDVTQDGITDMSDLVYMLRIVVKRVPEDSLSIEQVLAADVADADETITMNDLVKMLRYMVKRISTLE